MIAGFAAQVASLEAPLTEFLQEAFGGSKLDPAPFLRAASTWRRAPRKAPRSTA